MAWLNVLVTALLVTAVVRTSHGASIRFYGESMQIYEDYDLNNANNMVNSKYFTKNYLTMMFIHGYQGQLNGRAVNGTITAAIKRGGWNVCALNWAKEASSISLLGGSTASQAFSYGVKGVTNARLVGDKLGEVLVQLSDQGWNLTLTHLYGHSLGAHLAAFAGRTVKKSNLEVRHITGLDPSRALFEDPALQPPISSDCAYFVDCLHTDPGGLGINASNCHLDQWANYGRFLVANETERVQPDCPVGDYPTFSVNNSCSHDYSWRLIASSFANQELFKESHADTYREWVAADGTATPVTTIGEGIDETLRGNFYFTAGGEYPYGMGDEGLNPP